MLSMLPVVVAAAVDDNDDDEGHVSLLTAAAVDVAACFAASCFAYYDIRRPEINELSLVGVRLL
jgi:hypothetical protein